jgi:putative transposase
MICFKVARVSWQKAQRSQPRKDPELVKKKTQFIREILKDLMSDIKTGKLVVYAIDEVHLLEGDLLTYGWGDSKERLHIPIINEKNRQTYYGALDFGSSVLSMLNQQLRCQLSKHLIR